jgi:CubicO group peptidase (beta-lactamase class C family)
MVTFLSYAMGLRDSELKNSFELAQTPHYQINDRELVGLGWKLEQYGERWFISHAGRTPGFATFMGFDPESNKGVVVLSNTNFESDVIGMWALR